MSRPTAGLEVSQVTPGSAAAEAGLKQYDVIVEVDKSAVTTYAGLLTALTPGEHTIGYWDCQRRTVRTTVLKKEQDVSVGIRVRR
jgi:S1-C subfamily serine protease